MSSPRELLAALIERLPDDKIQKALEWLAPLGEGVAHERSRESSEQEVTEFVVSDSPTHRLQEPIIVRVTEPAAKVVLEVGGKSEALAASIEALTANARWWREHRPEVIARYRAAHVAISKGELFAAESHLDALAKARARHPEDMPFVIRLSDSDNVSSYAN